MLLLPIYLKLRIVYSVWTRVGTEHKEKLYSKRIALLSDPF